MPIRTSTRVSKAMQAAFSIPKIAERNAVSVRTVYNEIGAGRLIARKVGTRTIITAADEAAWHQALPKISPKAETTTT